jgi:hypothetical protein
MKRSATRLLARVSGVRRAATLAGAVFLVAGAHGAQAGMNVWTSHFLANPGGGEALAVDPISPTTLYAGGVGFGVIKSTDGGGIWSTANTGLPLDGQVGELVIDPHTPGILYSLVYSPHSAGPEGGRSRTTRR